MPVVRALALAGAVSLLAPAAAGAWPRCTPRAAPVRTGLEQVRRSRDGRLVSLVLRSRAMGRTEAVDVLLPAAYDPSGTTRYPVLYLLHGAGGDRTTWLRDYGAGVIGRLPVIVVLPDGSGPDAAGATIDGGYSDWFGVPAGRAGPPPAWESFHIRELVPFIDAHFPTRVAAAGRAVAGISMGGGGAMKYAAAFPGTFGYAASLSGELNPRWPTAVRFQPQTCRWGDPARRGVVWRDNDPTALAANLRGVRLFVRSGDGTPGPFDAPQPPDDPVEAFIRDRRLIVEYGAHVMAERFVAAARRAGVRDVDAAAYPGSHARPYWARELPGLLRWLAVQLRRPVRDRATFGVWSARRWFTAWGWRFTTRRRAPAVVRVRVRDGRVLTVTGAGRLAVRTPARLRPGRLYALRGGDSRPRVVRADRRGRLAFSVVAGRGPVVLRAQAGTARRVA